MDTLLNKFKTLINGSIKGFDRVVFKGLIRPIVFAAGMQNLLGSQGVLNKDYKNWVMNQSAIIVETANQYSRTVCGNDIIHIPSCHERKEELAHKQQQKLTRLSIFQLQKGEFSTKIATFLTKTCLKAA